MAHRLHVVCCFLAVVLINMPARAQDQKPPQISPAERALQTVFQFEQSLGKLTDPQERLAAARKFVAGLKDPTLKMEAIGMMDSRYVYTLPKELYDELLAPLLKDPDLRVRVRAARAVAYNGLGKHHKSALMKLLEEKSLDARKEALRALGRSNDKELLAIVAKYLHAPDASLRGQAVFLLGGSTSAYDKELAKLLNDPDPQVRYNVVSSGRVQDLAVLKKMAQDPSDHVRVGVVHALKNLQKPETAAIFAGLLKDKAPYVRGEAAKALGEMKSQAHIEAVAALLKDADVYVRRMATKALGDYADPRFREPLEKLLQTDPDTQMPEYAIQSLVKIGDKRSARVIAPFLKHKILSVQHKAILALGRLQAHDFADELLPFLKEPASERGWYRTPQLAAIEAIGLMGDPSYIGALQPFLQHQEQVIRIAARTAIFRLQPAPPQPRVR